MSDLRVLEDVLDCAWQRKVHLMAGKVSELEGYAAPAHATVKRFEDEIHLHHLQAAWPVRELVRMPLANDFDEREDAYRLVVIWWIGKQKVSQAMVEAGVAFALATGVEPRYALIRQIPAGAEEFVEVQGITLVRAGWVLPGFVAVTAGGMWRGLSYPPALRASPQIAGAQRKTRGAGHGDLGEEKQQEVMCEEG